MKLMVISGSRNPEGQTARAAGALIQGVESAGGTTELVFLPGMRIERCRQCDERGWGDCRSKGECVNKDDLAPLVKKIRDADAVAFANPVYFWDLSESLRAFLDRLRRICCHQDMGRQGIAGKLAVGICVAGGSGGGAPPAVVSLESVLTRCGFYVADMVPARRQNLDHKQHVLRATGQWLAAYAPQD